MSLNEMGALTARGLVVFEFDRVSMFCAGLVSFQFWLLEIIGEKRLSALLTLLGMLLDLTVGNVHQEQALVSVFWMPWLPFLLDA